MGRGWLGACVDVRLDVFVFQWRLCVCQENTFVYVNESARARARKGGREREPWAVRILAREAGAWSY